MKKMVKLPDSKIVLKDGLVMHLEEWTLWNGTPFKTMLIKREKEGFSSRIGDPEHGGRLRESKDLSSLLAGLHKDVSNVYINLFEMTDATPEKLKKDFSSYAVEAV